MGLGKIVRTLFVASALALSACSSTYTLGPRDTEVEISDHVFEREQGNLYYRGVDIGEHMIGGKYQPILTSAWGYVTIIDQGRERFHIIHEETHREQDFEGAHVKGTPQCPFKWLWTSYQ